MLGHILTEGMFTFELLDEQENVIATAKNRADGTIIFPAITYEKAGFYRYKLREVVGEDPNIAYATSTYEVKVLITEKDQVLKAEATYESPAVFINRYQETPPTTENPSIVEEYPSTETKVSSTSTSTTHTSEAAIPKTGDATLVSLLLTLALGSMLGFVSIVKYMKKRKR